MIRNQGEESFDEDLRTFLAVLPDAGVERLRLQRELAFGIRALLEHEAERLADRPQLAERVQLLRDAAGARLELADALDAEVEAAGIRAPVTTSVDALLHGRIVDPRLRGVADLRARLVDDQGRDVPEIEPAPTDAAGYYAFVLSPEIARRLASKPVSVVFDAGSERLTPAETHGVRVAQGTAVFNQVALAAPLVERLRPSLRPDLFRPDLLRRDAAKPDAPAAKPPHKPVRKRRSPPG